MLEKYTHKETWSRRGNNFLIEVVRWVTMSEEQSKKINSECLYPMGRFIWNIYFYLYPKHPLFKEAKGSDYSNCPIDSFHGGCTYVQWRRDALGETTCKQYGCDYAHYMDEHFQSTESPEDALEIFADAEALFNELEGTQNETI